MSGQTYLLVLVLVHESHQPIEDRRSFRLDVAPVEVEQNVVENNRPFHFRRGLWLRFAAAAAEEPASAWVRWRRWRRWRWWRWRRWFWLRILGHQIRQPAANERAGGEADTSADSFVAVLSLNPLMRCGCTAPGAHRAASCRAHQSGLIFVIPVQPVRKKPTAAHAKYFL